VLCTRSWCPVRGDQHTLHAWAEVSAHINTSVTLRTSTGRSRFGGTEQLRRPECLDHALVGLDVRATQQVYASRDRRKHLRTQPRLTSHASHESRYSQRGLLRHGSSMLCSGRQLRSHEHSSLPECSRQQQQHQQVQQQQPCVTHAPSCEPWHAHWPPPCAFNAPHLSTHPSPLLELCAVAS